MADPHLVERLRTLKNLAGVPREELEWLVDHGELETLGPGQVMGLADVPMENLFIVISGSVAVRVDRGSGPRLVIRWRDGEVTGMLPYSRMKAPPGDNFAEEATELLAVHQRHFPDMIRDCPCFTARTVHMMLDRARSFNTSDLQDEKMISLGKLSAGLAHELNNPASAIARSAKLLGSSLDDVERTSRILGSDRVSDSAFQSILDFRRQCQSVSDQNVLGPLEQADREDEIRDWLEERDLDMDLADTLASSAASKEMLQDLADRLSDDLLEAALQWIAATCSTRRLAEDVEDAATRIYDLVAAVKQFTYMDQRAGPEYLDVASGLGDTVRMLAAKARSKGVSVSLDIQPNLPPVHATGSELNQIWTNIIDNALDAVSKSGRIEIGAVKDLDRVKVRIVDDGPGIPQELLSRIFDPFFTTKPPGLGTGLGLDIARRLVRRNGGEIVVDSHPGRTEFCVSLRLKP